jgi:hypothetical protein
MDMDDDYEDMEDEEYEDEVATELSHAFPDEDWTEDRVMAFKEAVRLCKEHDEAPKKGKKQKGKKDSLALIFGE